MEPALPECGGGVLNGGDTGESGPGNGRGPSSTAIPSGVVWSGGPGAAGNGRIAPCWVLKEQPLVVVFQSLERSGSFAGCQAWPGLAYRRRLSGLVWGGSGCG